MLNTRETRAAEIADRLRIVNDGQKWLVPSQTGATKYTVRIVGERADCTCPDFELRRLACKHVLAVQYVIQREQNPDGTVTVTETVTVSQRKTYPQKWAEYNQAQTNEKDLFQAMLAGLCEGIETPEQTGKGQRRIPLSDAVFAATFKVYSTVSGRRFMSDLRESKERGFIDNAPHYNRERFCGEQMNSRQRRKRNHAYLTLFRKSRKASRRMAHVFRRTAGILAITRELEGLEC